MAVVAVVVVVVVAVVLILVLPDFFLKNLISSFSGEVSTQIGSSLDVRWMRWKDDTRARHCYVYATHCCVLSINQ